MDEAAGVYRELIHADLASFLARAPGRRARLPGAEFQQAPLRKNQQEPLEALYVYFE